MFGYAIRRAGLAEITQGIRRIGWGLGVVLMLGGLRPLVRAECWRLCVPPQSRLTLGRALSAFLAGDALGSVTPLGLLASEPTKVFLTRHHLATRESVASLAIENLTYAASVLVMIAIGVTVMLFVVAVPGRWRVFVIAGGVALIAGALAVPRLVRGMAMSGRSSHPVWGERFEHVLQAIGDFWGQNRARLARIMALEFVFHVLAVFETFITLAWVLDGHNPSLGQAIVFESMNRIVTVAFKFVPFRIGVDEAVSGALAPLLAVNPTVGVTLAIVRKVRNLFWAAVGLTLIATHPASTRPSAVGAD